MTCTRRVVSRGGNDDAILNKSMFEIQCCFPSSFYYNNDFQNTYIAPCFAGIMQEYVWPHPNRTADNNRHQHRQDFHSIYMAWCWRYNWEPGIRISIRQICNSSDNCDNFNASVWCNMPDTSLQMDSDHDDFMFNSGIPVQWHQYW